MINIMLLLYIVFKFLLIISKYINCEYWNLIKKNKENPQVKFRMRNHENVFLDISNNIFLNNKSKLFIIELLSLIFKIHKKFHKIVWDINRKQLKKSKYIGIMSF